MHLQHQPTCTTHHWAKPRMLVVFILGPEAQGKPGHRGPGWEDGQSGYGGGGTPCSVAAPAPRPRQRLRHRQAGITLGSDRGSHSLVDFLLELPEGREKGSEKGTLGIQGVPAPTDPEHQLRQAAAWAARSRTSLCCETWVPGARLALITHHGTGPLPSGMRALGSKSLSGCQSLSHSLQRASPPEEDKNLPVD